MRLDKFLSNTGTASRRDAAKAIRAGKVCVNGTIAKSADTDIDENNDAVTYSGERIAYSRFVYIMLDKPTGVVSATEDGDLTVIDLLPEREQKLGLFPCGRLDKNTTGFVLLTNDGELSHRLLSKKNHAEKVYSFTVKFPLSNEDCAALRAGVDIGGYVTKPCELSLQSECEGTITLTEGKYHQIKLMMEARHNKITSLRRISFAGIALDQTLNFGGWRYLTDEEIAVLRDNF